MHRANTDFNRGAGIHDQPILHPRRVPSNHHQRSHQAPVAKPRSDAAAAISPADTGVIADPHIAILRQSLRIRFEALRAHVGTPLLPTRIVGAMASFRAPSRPNRRTQVAVPTPQPGGPDHARRERPRSTMPFPIDPNAPGGPSRSEYLRPGHAGRTTVTL